jgi:neutral ceramidase
VPAGMAAAATLLLVACTGTVRVPPTPAPAATAPAVPGFRAGFGRADLTPPPGAGLFGYGPEGRRAEGFRQRLHARALVLEDARGERLALVTVELGAVPTILQRRVAEALHRRHSDGLGLGADRLFLAATHTHAGPGNFMGGMFDRRASSVPGHDPAILDFLVDGIVAAIESAHLDRSPAALAWGRAPVWGLTRNRSLLPFEANEPRASERFPPPDGLPATARSVDPELLVVRVDHLAPDGSHHPRGALALFSIHGTAVPSANALYDADLHGVVARAVEAHIEAAVGGGGRPRPRAVALFASGAAGDLSPAVPPSTRCPVARKRGWVPTPLAALAPDAGWAWAEPHPDSSEACLQAAIREMESVGGALAAEVSALYDALAGELDEEVTVSRRWSVLVPGEEEGLCPDPEVGSATPGGVADGITRLQGHMGIRQGRVDPDRRSCQAPKVRFLGPLQRLVAPASEFPGPAPFGVVRLGDLLIGTVPAEVTWTAGSRMRAAMAEEAAARGMDPSAVSLMTLTNGYLYYTATREEYGLQFYEGSSTLFGPGQAEVFGRRLAALVAALVPDGPSPEARVPPLEVHTPRPSRLLPPSRAVDPPDARLTAGCDGEGRLTARWLGVDPARQLPRPGPWVEVLRADTEERVGWDGHPGVEIRIGEITAEGRWWSLRFLRQESGVGYRIRLSGGASVDHACAADAVPAPTRPPTIP